ncbi:hypothetical protein [Roseisolibacter agri]|uniref:hypothetical protein n=1 Tax=Roseisolibacter agri TaxID=2014610 RepID=UPI0024E05E05|nr:hypothetical protein [Roseisolibacter agri]
MPDVRCGFVKSDGALCGRRLATTLPDGAARYQNDLCVREGHGCCIGNVTERATLRVVASVFDAVTFDGYASAVLARVRGGDGAYAGAVNQSADLASDVEFYHKEAAKAQRLGDEASAERWAASANGAARELKAIQQKLDTLVQSAVDAEQVARVERDAILACARTVREALASALEDPPMARHLLRAILAGPVYVRRRSPLVVDVGVALNRERLLWFPSASYAVRVPVVARQWLLGALERGETPAHVAARLDQLEVGRRAEWSPAHVEAMAVVAAEEALAARDPRFGPSASSAVGRQSFARDLLQLQERHAGDVRRSVELAAARAAEYGAAGIRGRDGITPDPMGEELPGEVPVAWRDQRVGVPTRTRHRRARPPRGGASSRPGAAGRVSVAGTMASAHSWEIPALAALLGESEDAVWRAALNDRLGPGGWEGDHFRVAVAPSRACEVFPAFVRRVSAHAAGVEPAAIVRSALAARASGVDYYGLLGAARAGAGVFVDALGRQWVVADDVLPAALVAALRRGSEPVGQLAWDQWGTLGHAAGVTGEPPSVLRARAPRIDVVVGGQRTTYVWLARWYVERATPVAAAGDRAAQPDATPADGPAAPEVGATTTRTAVEPTPARVPGARGRKPGGRRPGDGDDVGAATLEVAVGALDHRLGGAALDASDFRPSEEVRRSLAQRFGFPNRASWWRAVREGRVLEVCVADPSAPAGRAFYVWMPSHVWGSDDPLLVRRWFVGEEKSLGRVFGAFRPRSMPRPLRRGAGPMSGPARAEAAEDHLV